MKILKDTLQRIKLIFLFVRNSVACNTGYIKKFRRDVQILNSIDSVEFIKKYHCSVSRFGDGEFSIMLNLKDASKFQNDNAKLSKRLAEVINSDEKDGFKCAIPHYFKSMANLKFYSRYFWSEYLYLYGKRLFPNIDVKRKYLDAHFTRFYMSYRDKREAYVIARNIKDIWNDMDVLVVEGKFTRLGVGNDLFDNAKSVQRILCPPTSAFDKYDDILECTIRNAGNKLVLLSLGMTATVMAYDLYKAGCWAVDIGHIDVEYEWMKMGAKTKVNIANKFVNEASNGNLVEEQVKDSGYSSQIIAEILN